MLAEGFPNRAIRIFRSLDMRYSGQSYELNVPFAGDFISSFHRAHEQRYGYFDRSRSCEIVNLRARFTGPTPKPAFPRLTQGGVSPAAALASKSPVMFGRKRIETPIYHRAKLRAGNRIPGPAIVTEYSATTLIPLAWAAHVDRIGNLILEPRQ
jgi:N-methylhydantoinase A